MAFENRLEILDELSSDFEDRFLSKIATAAARM